MRRPAVLPLLFAALPLCSCAAPRLDAALRYGPVDVSGDVAVSSTGLVLKNDIESDLGVGGDDGVLGGRLDLDLGSGRLTLSTQTSDHAGLGFLTAEVSEDGVVIPVGAQVATRLELGVTDAVMTFDLVPADEVELGLGVGVSLVSFDSGLTEVATGQQVTTDEDVPIPVLAARLGVRRGDFELQALLAGLAVEIESDKASYLDFDAYARWRFLGGGAGRPDASALLGYRSLSIDLEYEKDGSVDAGLKFAGPYVGLLLSF